VLDVAGRTLGVTTTHLSYLPWRGLAQLAVAARAARHARGGSAVLLGDLNLPARVVRAALPGWRHAGGTPSYPWDEPRLQLDHILVRGDVRVVSGRTGPALTSDHLPVVADLELS
jgi:endonuclease/exonuclease/phosphatase family metal-dependent hydrolase